MARTLVITEKRKARLEAYLSDQYGLARRGESARSDMLRTFVARYEAKTVQKNFPFRGASSIHVPIVAEHADSIKAKMLNALKAQPDAFIDVNPLTEEQIGTTIDPVTQKPATWRLVSELLEEYMLYEISPAGQVNLIDAVETFVDDVTILGTGWLFPVWDTVQQWDFPDGGGRPSPSTVFDNVRFLNPAVEDVFYPPFYDCLDRIPWLGRRYMARPSEILARIGANGFNQTATVEFLDKYRSNVGKVSSLQQERNTLAGSIDPANYMTGELPLAETWMRFVLDEPQQGEGASDDPGDLTYGHEVRIVVDHSFDEPYTIFRITAWPYDHGMIPAVVGRYVKRRGMMAGMGIPERMESLDEGISTTANQAIDNVSAANTRLWRALPDSDAAEALEEIYCNKVIPAAQGEVEPMQMGEVYPSIFEIMNVLVGHAEKLSKVVDVPMQDVATARNSTATTTLAFQQEQGQYHDSTIRNVRGAIDLALQQWFGLIVQQKPLTRIRLILGPRAELLVTALASMSFSDLSKRIGVRVSFSTTAATRELGRQEEQAKLQIMQGYYQGLLALAAQRFGNMQAGIPPADPATALLIDQIAKDAHLRMQKLLEQYGERSSTSLLPDWQEVLRVYQQQQAQLAAQQQLAALTGGNSQAGAGAQSTNGSEASSPVGAGGTPGAQGMAGLPAPTGAASAG